MASLLRFFVEESLRTGGAVITQQSIATHVLSLPDGFRPSKSAYVRTHVTRLRQALHDYYETTGRDDPIIFTITSGPYRLIVSEAPAVADDNAAAEAGRIVKRLLPMLLIVEPDEGGCLARQTGIGRTVALQLLDSLVDSPFVTAAGPLLRSRLGDIKKSPEAIAADWGYDHVCDITLGHAGEGALVCSASATDINHAQRLFEETTTIRQQDDRLAAEGVANWLYHRISHVFMTLRVDAGSVAADGMSTLR
jgi:hypothetical protein